MSRTIKTMPPLVVAHDQHELVADHDHSKGECDLPPYPSTKRMLSEHGKWWKANCRWTYSATFWYSQHCGCRMCTAYYERLWERRQSRHNAKRDARQYLKYGED